MRKRNKFFLIEINVIISIWVSLSGGNAMPRDTTVLPPPQSFYRERTPEILSRWQHAKIMRLKHATTWSTDTTTGPTETNTGPTETTSWLKTCPTQTTPWPKTTATWPMQTSTWPTETTTWPKTTIMSPTKTRKQPPAKSSPPLAAPSQPFHLFIRSDATNSSPSSTSRGVSSIANSAMNSTNREVRNGKSQDEEAPKRLLFYKDFSKDHKAKYKALQDGIHYKRSVIRGIQQATIQYTYEKLGSPSRLQLLVNRKIQSHYSFVHTKHFQRSDSQIDVPLLNDNSTDHQTVPYRSSPEISESSSDSPQPSESSSDHWEDITVNTPNTTDKVLQLPICCDHHYQICSRGQNYRPDYPGASTGQSSSDVRSSNTLPPPSRDPDAGSQETRHGTAVCPLERSYYGETKWWEFEGGAEDPGPRHCANLDWCVLDVSHRAHTCINGNLYRSPWHTKMTITVCMTFPNDIWVRKSSAEVAVKVFFMLPIILVGVGANTIILYILSRNRSLHTPVNLFVGNLAVADLLLAAVCPTLFMLEDFYQHYVLGPVGCRLQGFIQTFLMMVSVLSLAMVCGERLVMVTGERLTVVVTPHKTRLSMRYVIAACCLVWVLGAIVASPLIVYRYFVDRLWLDYEETFCSEKPWMTGEYWPFLVVVLIWIPMVFLVISYMVIFCKLDQYEAAMWGRGHPIARRRRRRLLSLMFVILLVFLVCYTPYTVFLIVRAIVVKTYEEVDIYFDILWWMSHWLAYLNSAINPLIYGLTNEGFRKAWCSMCSICLPRHRAVAPASNDQAPPHRVQSCHASPDHQHRPKTPLVVEALRGSSECFLECPPSYMRKTSMYPTSDNNMATMDSMAF